VNPGVNRITRHSRDSALTIEVPQGSQIQTPPRIKGPQIATYCGCGWPSTLLLPRGSNEGMTFDLFVMLTNGDDDYVRPRNNLRRPGECKPAPIYCGRLNDTYPDSRPMGYIISILKEEQRSKI
jgi:tyrosinase